jgi:beta-glucosidase
MAVWTSELAWNAAFVAGDPGKLAEWETRQFVDTQPDGRVHTQADDIEEMKAGAEHISEMSLHEATVRITGDTAIVTGRLVVKGTASGGPFGEILESTDTLVRDGAVWRGVASAEQRLADTDNPAVTPLWRDGANWSKRHQGFADDAKRGGVDLLFVGDSITDFFPVRGKAVWDKYYGSRHAANLGISGDRTQHVLWRMENGEIDGLRPKLVVLLIGTNNLGLEHDGITPRGTPAEAAAGVKAVVAELRKRLPKSKILLLAIFPRSKLPTDPVRRQVAEVNRLISGLGDGKRVRYLDIGQRFLGPDGTIDESVMPDYLHPSEKGYEIWAQAMEPALAATIKPN